MSDGADWTSTGRLFQSRGPVVANEQSLTVISRDGRTSRRLEVDERSRPRRLDDTSATTEGCLIGTEVQCPVDNDGEFELDALGASGNWREHL